MRFFLKTRYNLFPAALLSADTIIYFDCCNFGSVLQCTKTLFRSYGAEKMILAYLGCYKLKATPMVKTTSPAEAKIYMHRLL
jgi:hypothetical protein